MAEDLQANHQMSAPDISTESLMAAVREAVQGQDLDIVSIREIRAKVSEKFGLPADGLDVRAEELKQMMTTIVQEIKTPDELRELLVSVAQRSIELPEKLDALQCLYLITITRIRAATLPDGREYRDLATMERKEIADAIRDAFDNPIATGTRGGRPRNSSKDCVAPSSVLYVIVFREHHSDGTVHFHAVLRLVKQCRFSLAKRTLAERHRLPSHFSVTHTQAWSAIRYLYIETPTKAEVDPEPWYWEKDGKSLDLFEMSQQPYNAEIWRKRREQKEKAAAGQDKKAKTTFTKLDMYAVIGSKHLYSKDQLMAYGQDYGTAGMQLYICKNQRQLQSVIDDAKEWHSARTNAAFEAIPDWDLIQQHAAKPCPHGPDCTYRKAVEEIFRLNGDCMDWQELAVALRDVITTGPTKTRRVPFLVGPSNSGKSTILYPMDDVFTPKRVLHKPALGSTFGLRNLANNTKRFIFWDDYRPVEFAQEKTVTVATFLSLFIGKHSEIQVSQSFNDGNADVCWNRGVAFTGKLEGLWEPTRRVSQEDVKHIRNRCREFQCLHTMQEGALKDIESCPCCMCDWIVRGSAAHDARAGLQPMLPVRAALGDASALDMGRVGAIGGLQELLAATKLTDSAAEALLQDLEEFGASGGSVQELSKEDWESLVVWGLLRPLQRRRLFQHLDLK